MPMLRLLLRAGQKEHLSRSVLHGYPLPWWKERNRALKKKIASLDHSELALGTHISGSCYTFQYIVLLFFNNQIWPVFVLFFVSETTEAYWKIIIIVTGHPLCELSQAITFHLIHPRKKSGIQLRSQIVWTFHFCYRFDDQRHPLDVRLKCLPKFSCKKNNAWSGY